MVHERLFPGRAVEKVEEFGEGIMHVNIFPSEWGDVPLKNCEVFSPSRDRLFKSGVNSVSLMDSGNFPSILL